MQVRLDRTTPGTSSNENVGRFEIAGADDDEDSAEFG